MTTADHRLTACDVASVAIARERQWWRVGSRCRAVLVREHGFTEDALDNVRVCLGGTLTS